MLVYNLVILPIEKPSHGTKFCGCSSPCDSVSYEVTISNSLLDPDKIKHDILDQPKSAYLLGKHRKALEVAAQV